MRLRYYAAGLTLFAGIVLLGASREAGGSATFDAITVHRIDVVDREGKAAMIITDRDDYPPPVIDGKTFRRQGLKSENGVVFYNQSGDEQGALVWDGDRRADGSFASENALLFDSVDTDQLAGVQDCNENGKTCALFEGWDQIPLDAEVLNLLGQMEQLATAQQRRAFFAAHPILSRSFKTRYAFGYGEDGTALLLLADKDAKPRVKMFVTAGGQAELQFLDAHGNVTAEYPGTH